MRGLPAAGILDRCTATKTCPKIIERFGSAEVWALKLTPEWVGTDAKADLPLPDNRQALLHRQLDPRQRSRWLRFQPSRRGPAQDRPAVPRQQLWCRPLLPANPVPHTQTVNALRVHFRDWVMKGVPPPPSRFPQLAQGTLARADKAAIDFPTLPGLRATVPEPDFIMPVLDYDWGSQFNAQDGSGIASNAPPRVKQVLTMFAPKVDADGNELGGVPVVLLDAPLGTYLGWNVTASGEKPFHKDQICNYVGGMLPFARTAEERKATNDPRQSPQERYGSHEGYVEAVTNAAAKALARASCFRSTPPR